MAPETGGGGGFLEECLEESLGSFGGIILILTLESAGLSDS